MRFQNLLIIIASYNWVVSICQLICMMQAKKDGPPHNLLRTEQDSQAPTVGTDCQPDLHI